MAKPIVAIVGRPNVGKSTLFNKIAGQRISIVEDTPGVTRDRVYADAEWLNHHFKLIDTGGIEPKSEDLIFRKMKRQANLAIDMADVIIFIVDGKQGLTDSDREVAQILRKSQKPVILTVNKIDSMKEEANVFEFFNIGIGTPISISASQGLGLGDLLDEVISHFDKHSKDEDDDYIRVAFVGRPNVGKSSLINKLLGEERAIVTNIPGTTRDSIDSYLETEEGKFILIDTAGLRRKSRIKEDIERYSAVRTIASIERADVVILMVDAVEGVSDQDEKIIGYAHEMSKAILVVVNKWDLIEKDQDTMKNYINQMRWDLKFLAYAPFIFISALTGQRTHKVLEEVKKCYDNYSKKIRTAVLNDVISKALLAKEPPIKGTKRLRIYYGTQTGTKPPTFVFFVNDKKAMHFSYERYIENQLRKSFDFEGTGLKINYRERKRDER